MTRTLQEPACGVKTPIHDSRYRTCAACGGSGAAAGSKPETCPACGGRGQRTTVQQTLFGQMQQVVTCDRCRGTGKIIKNPCPNCRGTGLEKENCSISVDIPAGIDDGQGVRLAGKGNEGKNGGPAGNLFIEVAVRRSDIFKRDGNDIFCEVPVTVTEATLGAEIEIPTLEGIEKFDLPEGTQPGTSFTLKQKGIPDVSGRGRRGNLVFTVKVEIPKGLSEKQKKLLRDFSEACGDTNFAKKKRFWKK